MKRRNMANQKQCSVKTVSEDWKGLKFIIKILGANNFQIIYEIEGERVHFQDTNYLIRGINPASEQEAVGQVDHVED
jgi:hypothetical protein